MPETAPDIVWVKFADTELRYLAPDSSDHIQRVLREGHVYEEGLLLDCFSRTLPRGVIIDVGANIGNHTVVFAKVLGRKVVGIEPYARAFNVLQRNVELNGVEERVTLLAAAAGRKRGRATIQAPAAGNWGRASVQPAEDGELEMVRLDDLDIEGPVALLKIDVEGMENDVLAGARRLIKYDRPVIYVETQSASQHALVKRRLARLGYRLVRRFNHTPTYLFVSCRSQQDEMAALLDKTDVLSRLEDVAAVQHDVVRMLSQLVAAAGQPAPANPSAVDGDQREAAAHELLAELKPRCDAILNLLGCVASEQKSRASDLGSLSESLKQSISELPARVAEAVQQTLSSELAKTRPTVRRRRRVRTKEHGVEMPVKLGEARLMVRLATAAAPGGGTKVAKRAESRTGRGSQGRRAVIGGPNVEGDAASCSVDAVSVIMTTCNSEDFVEEAARNVLAQTHRNLELIVVDDASDDGTWDVLSRLAREDARVRPVKMFKNRGTYWCKNYGLKIAQGRYVTFQDSDDRSDPDRVRLQLQELATTGAVACTCNYVRVDSTGAVVANRGLTERKAIMASLLDREEVLRHAGYFDSVRTSADDEFTRRLGIVFGQERICHVDKPLYMATVREGSLTNNAQTRAEINCETASATDKSFLSAPRREYVRQYSAWHERLKAGDGSPRMPFPLIRRPFPAPAILLPDGSPGDSFVTVSMASFPARAELLKQTVASILPQADRLNIYLNGYSSTPQWLVDERIQVIHSSEYGDLRDNGKFFFLDALLPGYHFTIDDDIIYPPDYVEKLILKIEQYDRRAIVGVHGVILAKSLVRFMDGRTVLHFKQKADSDRFVNLLGTGTTAYHTDALKLSLEDFPHPGMADVWLAIAARRQGVPMVAIERPDRWLIPLEEAEETSLFAAARRDDAVQTAALKDQGCWDIRALCESFDLCRELRTRHTPDELASQGVDIEVLATDAANGVGDAPLHSSRTRTTQKNAFAAPAH